MSEQERVWSKELPSWKRGWAKSPNGHATLIEFHGEEINGVSGGYYGTRDKFVDRGWLYGPAMPSPQECAALPRLVEALRDIEFGNTGGCVARCPSCNCAKPNHAVNCALAEALKAWQP